MRPRVLILGLLALIGAALGGASLASRDRPASGLVDGRLRPHPTTPSSVSSQAVDPTHAIAPLVFSGDPHEAFARAVSIVTLWPRSERLALEERYAHFELCSPWLRLRSDLELLLDEPAGVIHVRVAARVGQHDLGSSRARAERLRAAFEGR